MSRISRQVEETVFPKTKDFHATFPMVTYSTHQVALIKGLVN